MPSVASRRWNQTDSRVARTGVRHPARTRFAGRSPSSVRGVGQRKRLPISGSYADSDAELAARSHSRRAKPKDCDFRPHIEAHAEQVAQSTVDVQPAAIADIEFATGVAAIADG